MGDIFSPAEKINNIIFTIRELQDRLHESDTQFSSMWLMAIKENLTLLNKTLAEMKIEV